MRSVRILCPVLAVLALAALTVAGADVTLNGMFTSNMVLQREMPVPIFGKAAPGEQVTVTIGEVSKTATAGEDGKWKVVFEPLTIAGPFEVKVAGANEVILTNVVMGDVWICSGQSNMAMGLASCLNAQEEIAAANFPDLRLYNYPRKVSQQPTDEVAGSWVPCSPTTVPGFSGVGYFFGRYLHQELGVPIGLINTSWGGTAAEAWTSLEKLQANPLFQSIFDRWATLLAAYPAAMEKYNNETLPEWQRKADEAKAAGQPIPRRPQPPPGPDSPNRPANLFNGMINPIVGVAIKGAIWYQGESNAGRAWEYRTLLPTMIEDWRERWGQGDFPFGIVQLANFRAVQTGPEDSAWAELREAQTVTALNDPNNGIAVIIDVGDAADIHPKDKQTVGKRLGLWALARVYGQDIVYYGPMYKSMAVEGNSIRISFDHVGGGLTTQATANAPDPTTLVGFTIAGEDQQFVMAQATIDGATVVVRAEGVTAPVAVRYGWANNPVCNLFNAEGLPANPFRTDSWKLTTQPAEPAG